MIIKASRVEYKGIVFHSTDYNRGSCNSYTVSYVQNDEKRFGVVEHYLVNERSGSVMALVLDYKILGTLKDLLLPPDDSLMKELYDQNLYGNYHHSIDKSTHESYIHVTSFVSRCIIVTDSTQKRQFICEVDTGFEHN